MYHWLISLIHEGLGEFPVLLCLSNESLLFVSRCRERPWLLDWWTVGPEVTDESNPGSEGAPTCRAYVQRGSSLGGECSGYLNIKGLNDKKNIV